VKKDGQPRLFIPFTVGDKNFTGLSDKSAMIIFIVLSVVLLLGLSLLPKSPIPAASVLVPVPAASVTMAQ